MNIVLSEEQARRFIELPEARKLFRAALAGVKFRDISFEAIAALISQYSKFDNGIVIHDEKAMPEEQFNLFCERFCWAAREAGL